MDRELEQLVWSRAERRCEYCKLPAAFSVLGFQIDHIIAVKHRGETESENLALSCCYCNRFKGPNIAGISEKTGQPVRLFHPRKDSWSNHFKWDGATLIGKTEVGDVTIFVLNVNDADAVAVRASLIAEGVFPEPEING